MSNEKQDEVPIDLSEATEVLAPMGVLDAQTRGEIDMQIATAKRYPRSIKKFKETALEMATLDEDTAAACIYALPRDNKTIEGPSARLAEIIVSAWGNSRAGARTISDEGNFVTAQGAFHDLERNVAINFEVRRRITNKHGKRYGDDMISVTANAACSIALRNAVLKGIPKAFWSPIYEAAKKTAIGDAQTLANRRATMLEYFQKMGATKEMVFALLQVKGSEDITLEHMAVLKGLATAIKEGETSVDDAFAPPASGQPPTTAVNLRHAKQAAATASAPSIPSPPPPPESPESPETPTTPTESTPVGAAAEPPKDNGDKPVAEPKKAMGTKQKEPRGPECPSEWASLQEVIARADDAAVKVARVRIGKSFTPLEEMRAETLNALTQAIMHELAKNPGEQAPLSTEARA